MKIEQVQGVVDNLDRIIKFYAEYDPMMMTRFVEESLVDGINRSICRVLGGGEVRESTLRNIRDVEVVAGRLKKMMEEGSNLIEIEDFFVEIMGIRGEVSFEAEDVMKNWGRSKKYRLRIQSLFKFMKANFGKSVFLDDLVHKISEIDETLGVKKVPNYRRIAIKILRNMMVRSEYHQYESDYLCHYAVEEVKENGKIEGYVMRKVRK